MNFRYALLFSLTLIPIANAQNLSNYVTCLKAINHPQWYHIMDDRAKMLSEDIGLFVGTSGKQREKGLAVINATKVIFYPFRLAGREESQILGDKWINTAMNVDFNGEAFNIRIQERQNSSVFTEIMTLKGRENKSSFPFKDVKGETLSEESVKVFLPQAKEILKSHLDRLIELQKRFGKIDQPITESCAIFNSPKGK